jgi:hydrogenase maturation protein HypF
VLTTMMQRGVNAPLSSSCGRLFDAVAAALGLSLEAVTYEGQAAMELEALAVSAMHPGQKGYPFGIAAEEAALILDPKPMWFALLRDLARGEEAESVAARFHVGLAEAVARMATALAQEHEIGTAALSGGVFQNKILLETVSERLRGAGLRVLGHKQIPANDSGISLGQATIAAARRRDMGP